MAIGRACWPNSRPLIQILYRSFRPLRQDLSPILREFFSFLFRIPVGRSSRDAARCIFTPSRDFSGSQDPLGSLESAGDYVQLSWDWLTIDDFLNADYSGSLSNYLSGFCHCCHLHRWDERQVLVDHWVKSNPRTFASGLGHKRISQDHPEEQETFDWSFLQAGCSRVLCKWKPND